VAVTSPDTNPPMPAIGIRPPLQRRSRESWERVLDSGVRLLEMGGYEAFTIAAVCKEAQVAPRALYARVESKEALFLAVYEHGMSHVMLDVEVFADDARWQGLAPEDIAAHAVLEVAGIFERHADFLRAVVLISGVHPEVYRRGAFYSQDLGHRFAARLLSVGAGSGQTDPEAAVLTAFDSIFATLVLRTAYGPGFSTIAAVDETSLVMLTTMVQRFLFGR